MNSLPPVRRLASACALALVPLFASAAPRPAATSELQARMEAAEARYTKAVVNIRNEDPAARRESDAALQEMEEVMAACVRQRGCPVNSMVATYSRLLKRSIDAESTDGDDDDDEPAADALGHQDVSSTVPQAARAAALLSDDHRFDRMVEYNPAVQQAIRRWLTDMRGSLIASHENYQAMRYLMWPEFEKRGLPEALLFGIMAKESNGKVHATSRAGAAGPMQFMYATGRRFGLGDDGTGFDTRYDPRSAAMASAEYLNERMGQLNRNIELALAAYNGGEGRALRVYQGSGGRTFWDESVYNQFPAETRDYVPMVIAAAWLFLHPKEYGLTFTKGPPKPAPLRLSQPASIYQLSICLGNRGVREGYMRTLRNLNPRYQPETFIPAGTSLNATTQIVGLYNRWCVSGARADLARTLVLSDPSRAVVRTGSLRQVSSSGDDVSAPADAPVAPPISAPAPQERERAAAARSDAGDPKGAKDSRKTAKEPKDAKDDARTGKSTAGKRAASTHRVRAGESLDAIARRYDCEVDGLAKANGIRRAAEIQPGQVLRLEGCGR